MPLPVNNTDIRETTSPLTFDIVEKANWYLGSPIDQVSRARRYGHFDPGKYATESAKIIVPLMRKIVDFSANRVAGHELILSADDDNVAGWLEQKARDTNLHSAVVKGLRWGSAYGGFYMRPVLGSDGTYSLGTVRPDHAKPWWEGSRLKGVCIRIPLGPDAEGRWGYNLFEDHQMVPMVVPGPNGPEIVLDGGVPMMVSVVDYGLYYAKESKDEESYPLEYRTRDIGIMVPLEDHPDTMHLADEQVAGGVARVVLEGLDSISAEYVPNTAGRFDSLLQNEGDSDFTAVYDLLDLVDHSWTMVGDAIDKGRPRLVIHEDMLDSGNPYRRSESQGLRTFDQTAGLILAMTGPPADFGDGSGIAQIKFDMQLRERLDALNEINLWILRNAGFSPQSFGLQTENAGDSGLAREYREMATRETVEQKRALLTEPLRRVLSAMAVLEGQPSAEVSVNFPAQNIQSQTERADIATKLWGAGLGTMEDMQKLLHPNMSEQELVERAEEVREENRGREATAFEPDSGNNLGERATGEAPGDRPL